MKVAALFALVIFWFNKGSNVKVLSGVWGHTRTGYALLVLLLHQYALQGLIFHIMRARKLSQLLEAKLFRVPRLQGPMYFTVMMCPTTGVLMMMSFQVDVRLFLCDSGIAIPFVDQHCDLEEYQLFRNVGRALFGSLPIAILQSATFNIGTNAWDG